MLKVSRNQILAAKQQEVNKQRMKKVIATLNTSAILLGSVASVKQVTEVEATEVSKQDQFIQKIGQSARTIGQERGLYASVMIAQAALESGWGTSLLAQAPNHNLFGIKGSYQGQSANMNTLEDDGTGRYYQIKDDFRRYPDYHASLADYADLLTGGGDPSSWRYKFYQGARRSHAATYQDATAHLTGRYATDTSYGSKLNRIIEQFQLTTYDQVDQAVRAQNPLANPAGQNGSANQSAPASVDKTYTIKAGDSLYRIATNHGLTLKELMDMNQLSNYMIHPHQVLKVGKQTVAAAQPEPTTPAGPSAQTNSAAPANQTGQSGSANQSAPASVDKTYTIKAGDSLYRIATNHGLTLKELMDMNQLSNYMIHPHQVLKVGKQTVASPAPAKQSAQSSQTAPAVANTPTPAAPAAQTPAPSSRSDYGAYQVRAGDSCWRIARQHGISVTELKRLNNLTSNLIHPGQALKVPASTAATPSQNSAVGTQSAASTTTSSSRTNSSNATSNASANRPAAQSPAQQLAATYRVQAGDSYWKIANRYGMTLDELKALNQADSYLIHPGDELKVRSQNPSPASSPAVVEQNIANPRVPASTPPAPTQLAPTVPAQAAPAPAAAPSSQTYTVVAGDTLYSIARRNQLNVYDLIEANGGDLIYPGQSINLN